MAYEADTLKEILRTTWSLTGMLSAEGTASANSILRPVKFFARDQIDEKIESKAVEVHKVTPTPTGLDNEFFTEESDIFKIRIVYKLSGTSKTDIDDVEGKVEDMEQEINRIIKLTYNPQSGIGVFWSSDFVWKDVDEFNHAKNDPYIIRELTLTLKRLVSRSTSVFDSFQRGAFFDLSESDNMDSAPAADFSYTEVFDISKTEGFRNTELDVTRNPEGVGIPLYYSGRFGGTMIMHSYLKAEEIGSTDDKMNQIYKRKTNGEHVEAAIVRTYTNNNSQTVTMTSYIRVETIDISEGTTEFLQWILTAKIIKPTTIVIS